MADKDIEIGIKATGGDKSAAEIKKLEREVASLRKELKKVPTDSEAFDEMARKVVAAEQQLKAARSGADKFTESSVNMRGAVSNLGFQLQDMAVQAEMGVSPLRIISQQVPQLLGGFGAFGAIAGAAIGIGVPLAASLFKLGDGAAESADDIGDLTESLDNLKEAYEGIYQLMGEDQEQAAKKAAQRVAETLSGIKTKVSVDTDAASLQAAKEKADAQLNLVKDRIRLAELEKQVATATGTEALRLAKEREATIRRIYDAELAISEVARKEALAAAQAKTRGAAKTLGQQAVASQTAEQALAAQQAEQERLFAAYQAETSARLNMVKELEAELEKRKANLRFYQENNLPENRGAREAASDEVNRVQDALNKARQASDSETSLAVQVAAMQAGIDQLKAKSEEAAKAQQAAAEAMDEAARALVQLRDTQDVQRKSEAELKATEAIGAVGRDVTQAALDAIAQIQQNAAQQGRAVNPGEQEAIGRIQSLVKDTTPDAQQGGQLAGLLQSLSNNLTAKDATLANGINRLITLATQQDNKYKALFDRLEKLENRVNQLR